MLAVNMVNSAKQSVFLWTESLILEISDHHMAGNKVLVLYVYYCHHFMVYKVHKLICCRLHFDGSLELSHYFSFVFIIITLYLFIRTIKEGIFMVLLAQNLTNDISNLSDQPNNLTGLMKKYRHET